MMISTFNHKLLSYVYFQVYLKKHYFKISFEDFLTSNSYFLSDKLCENYIQYKHYCFFGIIQKLKINISRSEMETFLKSKEI